MREHARAEFPDNRLLNLFERIFREISGVPDFEYALIDGTVVQVHQKAAGAKGRLKIRP